MADPKFTTTTANGVISADGRGYTHAGSGAAVANCLTDTPIVGKQYLEIQIHRSTASSVGAQLYGGTSENLPTNVNLGSWYQQPGAAAQMTSGWNLQLYANSSLPGELSRQMAALPGSADQTLYIQFAIDADTREVWVRRSGDGWDGGGDPATGTSPSFVLAGDAPIYPGANSMHPDNHVRLLTADEQVGEVPAGFSQYMEEAEPSPDPVVLTVSHTLTVDGRKTGEEAPPVNVRLTATHALTATGHKTGEDAPAGPQPPLLGLGEARYVGTWGSSSGRAYASPHVLGEEAATVAFWQHFGFGGGSGNPPNPGRTWAGLIYADDSGEPGALLHTTGAAPVGEAGGWQSIPLEVDLPPGTYWLATLVSDWGVTVNSAVPAEGGALDGLRLGEGAGTPTAPALAWPATSNHRDGTLTACITYVGPEAPVHVRITASHSLRAEGRRSDAGSANVRLQGTHNLSATGRKTSEVLPPGPEPPLFGWDFPGIGGTWGSNIGRIMASRAVLDAEARLTDFWQHFGYGGDSGSTQPGRTWIGMVYSDVDGEPGVLLAVSQPVASDPAGRWQRAPMNAYLPPGTYWLATQGSEWGMTINSTTVPEGGLAGNIRRGEGGSMTAPLGSPFPADGGGNGTLSAAIEYTPWEVPSVAVTVSAGHGLSAGGHSGRHGTPAALTASHGLQAGGTAQRSGTATMTAAHALQASGQAARAGSATLTTGHATQATGSAARAGMAVVPVTTSLRVSGHGQQGQVRVTLTATHELQAAGGKRGSGVCRMGAGSGLAARGGKRGAGTTRLTGTGSLRVRSGAHIGGEVTLRATSGLRCSGHRGVQSIARLQAASGLAATGSRANQITVALPVTHGLRSRGIKATAGGLRLPVTASLHIEGWNHPPANLQTVVYANARFDTVIPVTASL